MKKINYKNIFKNTDLRFLIRNLSKRVVTVVASQIRVKYSKLHGEIVQLIAILDSEFEFWNSDFKLVIHGPKTFHVIA